MKDPHKAFRMAVFQALNGNLTDLSSSSVKVFDGKAEETVSNIYVLLTTETGNQIPNFSLFLHDSSIILQVVTKTTDAISKDELDNVSDQITQILLPGTATDGLVQQSGFQINCLQAQSVNSSEVNIVNAKTEASKFLRLTAKIAQA
jgi:hypothetical protein